MRQSAITSAYRRAYADRFGCGQCGLGQARRTQAVMFTGSTEVARRIAKQLAGRLNQAGQPIPLVAETGGLNVMVVDSSTLAEQVVADVIHSAFDSAGQRCLKAMVVHLMALAHYLAEHSAVVIQPQGRTVAELEEGISYRLERLLVERSLNINTAAAGGNATLMAMI